MERRSSFHARGVESIQYGVAENVGHSATNTPALSVASRDLEVISMGDVAVVLKVMPEDDEVDLEEIKKEINTRLDPSSIEEDPVAFGLVALKVLKVIPDDAGGTDEIEEKISEIENVKNVEVVDQRRLL